MDNPTCWPNVRDKISLAGKISPGCLVGTAAFAKSLESKQKNGLLDRPCINNGLCVLYLYYKGRKKKNDKKQCNLPKITIHYFIV